jgi:hypothetical protein
VEAAVEEVADVPPLAREPVPAGAVVAAPVAAERVSLLLAGVARLAVVAEAASLAAATAQA